MAIVLTETTVPAVEQKVIMNGHEIYNLGEGDRVRIQVQVDGETTTVFDETVPFGKEWEARITALIEETSA